MKKVFYFILFGFVMLFFASCNKDDVEIGSEADLIGKWKNDKKAEYRVFYSETTTYENETYKWGKEWDETEEVFESDLVEHGNGWFMWKKNNANMLEIHKMDNDGAVIPREYTISTLTSTTFKFSLAGTSYSYTKQ